MMRALLLSFFFAASAHAAITKYPADFGDYWTNTYWTEAVSCLWERCDVAGIQRPEFVYRYMCYEGSNTVSTNVYYVDPTGVTNVWTNYLTTFIYTTNFFTNNIGPITWTGAIDGVERPVFTYLENWHVGYFDQTTIRLATNYLQWWHGGTNGDYTEYFQTACKNVLPAGNAAAFFDYLDIGTNYFIESDGCGMITNGSVKFTSGPLITQNWTLGMAYYKTSGWEFAETSALNTNYTMFSTTRPVLEFTRYVTNSSPSSFYLKISGTSIDTVNQTFTDSAWELITIGTGMTECTLNWFSVTNIEVFNSGLPADSISLRYTNEFCYFGSSYFDFNAKAYNERILLLDSYRQTSAATILTNGEIYIGQDQAEGEIKSCATVDGWVEASWTATNWTSSSAGFEEAATAGYAGNESRGRSRRKSSDILVQNLDTNFSKSIGIYSFPVSTTGLTASVPGYVYGGAEWPFNGWAYSRITTNIIVTGSITTYQYEIAFDEVCEELDIPESVSTSHVFFVCATNDVPASAASFLFEKPYNYHTNNRPELRAVIVAWSDNIGGYGPVESYTTWWSHRGWEQNDNPMAVVTWDFEYSITNAP